MSRNPCAGKVSRTINTTVEVKTVEAEKLNRPEVVEIQPTEKKKEVFKNNQ